MSAKQRHWLIGAVITLILAATSATAAQVWMNNTPTIWSLKKSAEEAVQADQERREDIKYIRRRLDAIYQELLHDDRDS